MTGISREARGRCSAAGAPRREMLHRGLVLRPRERRLWQGVRSGGAPRPSTMSARYRCQNVGATLRVASTTCPVVQRSTDTSSYTTSARRPPVSCAREISSSTRGRSRFAGSSDELLGAKVGAQDLGQPAIGRLHLDDPGQVSEQCLPGVRVVEGVLGRRRHLLEVLLEHGVDEGVLGGKPAIERSDPDAGAGCYFLDACVGPELGKCRSRSCQDPVAVLASVASERPRRGLWISGVHVPLMIASGGDSTSRTLEAVLGRESSSRCLLSAVVRTRYCNCSWYPRSRHCRRIFTRRLPVSHGSSRRTSWPRRSLRP